MSEFGLKAVIDATSAEEGERKLIKSFQAIKKAAEEAAAAVGKVGKGAAAGAASVTQRGMAALGGGGGRGIAGGAPNFGNVGTRTRVERAEAAYLRDQQRNTALVMRAQEGLRQAAEETAAAWQNYYQSLQTANQATKSAADSAKALEAEFKRLDKISVDPQQLIGVDLAAKSAANSAKALEAEFKRLDKISVDPQQLIGVDLAAKDAAASARAIETEFRRLENINIDARKLIGIEHAEKSARDVARTFQDEFRRLETMIGRAENRAENLRMRSQRMLRDDPTRRGSVNASIDEALNNYRETLRSVGSQSTEAVQAQNALNMAFTRISGTISDEGGLLRAMQNSNDMVREMAVRFRQTGQAISVLDGPLGGIASRFRSFGMLINHGGIAIAGMATGLAALVFGLRRAVTDFSNFEARMLAVDAMVERIDSSIGITTEGVEKLVRQMDSATLGTADHLREAAAQILAFGDNAAREFERTMWLAQDLSSLGFGSVQQAAQRLSRAMEEPEQALNQLRRMNIIFTQSQRDMILALREAGHEIEAQGLFLDILEEKIGGAASKIGSGMAGTLSSLGQATEEFFLELGDTALARGVTEAIGLISEGINWLTRNFDLAVDRALQFGSALFVLTRMGTIHTVMTALAGATTTVARAFSSAAAAKALYTAAATRAAAATTLLSRAIAANPIGLLLTGLTTAAALFFSFNIQTRDAARASLDEAEALARVNSGLRENNAERAEAAERRRSEALAEQELLGAELANLQERRRRILEATEGPGRNSPAMRNQAKALQEAYGTLAEIDAEILEVTNKFERWGRVAELAAGQATEALGAVSERGLSEAAQRFRDETIKAIREFNQTPMEALESSAWFRGSSEEVQAEMRAYQSLRDGLEETKDAGRLVKDTLKDLRDEAMEPADRAARDYAESLAEMTTSLDKIEVGIKVYERNLHDLNVAIRDQRAAVNLLSGDEEKREKALRVLMGLEQQRDNLKDVIANSLRELAKLEGDIADVEENRAAIIERLIEAITRKASAAARTIENLQTELSATTRMNAALLQNEAAVAALNLQLEKEENLRRAGEDATEKERRHVEALTEALWNQKRAQDAIEGARGMLDTFAEESLSAIERASKPFDEMLARLAQIDRTDLGKEAADSLEDLVRGLTKARDAAVDRARAERDASVRQIELDTMRAEGLELQADALELLDERHRRYEDLVAQGVSAEKANELVNAWYRVAGAIDSSAAAARAYREETLRSIADFNQQPGDRLAQMEASQWFQDAGAEAQAFYRSLHEMNEALIASKDAGAPLRDVLKEIAGDGLSPAEKAMRDYEEGVTRMEAAHSGMQEGIRALVEEDVRLALAIEAEERALAKAKAGSDEHAVATATLSDLKTRHAAVSLALSKGLAEEAALEEFLTEVRARQAEILDRLTAGYTSQASAAEQLLENLRTELDATARLNAALLQNEAAVDAVSLQLEIEANLRRAGEEATEAQRQEIQSLTAALWEQKRAQDAIREAQGLMNASRGDGMNALERAVEPFDKVLEDLGRIDLGSLGAGSREAVVSLQEQVRAARADALEAAMQEQDAVVRQIELETMRAQGLEQVAIEIERMVDRQKRYDDLVDAGVAPERARELADAWYDATRAYDENARKVEEFERIYGNSINTLSSSFGEFITGQKEGLEALRDVAAAVAQDIINEFMRVHAIQPLVNFLGGATSSLFGGGISAVEASAPATIAANPGIFHKGGRAGIDRVPTRPVPAEVFRDAPRYHRGGIAGLGANEVPAILERGERVIPNGASAQGGTVVINTNVSVNVEGGQGGQTTDTQQAQRVGEEVARQVRTAIAEEIQHLRRPGNMLNPVF